MPKSIPTLQHGCHEDPFTYPQRKKNDDVESFLNPNLKESHWTWERSKSLPHMYLQQD